jgi:hypothetical protein
MNNHQNQRTETQNKFRVGTILTKTALIFGIGGLIGYSTIKDKLLGRPRSKIRKGLFYATMAGFILYKCQGEKIEKLYQYSKQTVAETYDDFYELKKEKSQKTIELKILEDSCRRADAKNEQLEKIVGAYAAKDTFIDNVLEERNRLLKERSELEKKLEYEKIRFQNEKIINAENKKTTAKKPAAEVEDEVKLEDKIEESNHTSFLCNGMELKKVKDNFGNYKTQIDVYNLANENIIWLISDGTITYNKISKECYGETITADRLIKYNRAINFGDSPIAVGMPVALPEINLVKGIKGINIYKGGFPRSQAVQLYANSIDETINKYYAEDSKLIDVKDAIEQYNKLYFQDLNENRKKAMSSECGYYYILIPRFLKSNIIDSSLEFWVNENEKSGNY